MFLSAFVHRYDLGQWFYWFSLSPLRKWLSNSCFNFTQTPVLIHLLLSTLQSHFGKCCHPILPGWINNLQTDEIFKGHSFLQVLLFRKQAFTGESLLMKMSKRRWVEFKICQTISCSAPVSRRHRPSSPAAAAAGMFQISN